MTTPDEQREQVFAFFTEQLGVELQDWQKALISQALFARDSTGRFVVEHPPATQQARDEYTDEVEMLNARYEINFGLRFGMGGDAALRAAANNQNRLDRVRLREIARLRKGREDAAKLEKLSQAVEQVKDICARAGYIPMPGDDGVSMRAVDGARIHRILTEAQNG